MNGKITGGGKMSKLKEKFDKLIDFFKPKNTVVDREEGSDDYTVKRSKKADLIIRIFSILAAIIIWIYAVSADGAIKTTDYQFTNADIIIENEDVLSDRSFDISIADTNIVVTVKGRKFSATDSKKSRVKLSVDAAKINSAGETMMKLDVDLPIGVTLVSVSPEYIKADVSARALQSVLPSNGTTDDEVAESTADVNNGPTGTEQ